MVIPGLKITNGVVSKKLIFCTRCGTLKAIDATKTRLWHQCSCNDGKDTLHQELQLDYFKD